MVVDVDQEVVFQVFLPGALLAAALEQDDQVEGIGMDLADGDVRVPGQAVDGVRGAALGVSPINDARPRPRRLFTESLASITFTGKFLPMSRRKSR